MSTQNGNASNLQTATLGGGCFWCLDAVYRELKGVHDVISGYAGGHVPNPTYEQVCGKRTGHAEVVQVAYDPDQVSYRDLIKIFYTIHDPTTPDRQGNDVGPQYRSIILTHDEEQARVAREETEAAQAMWDDPIVTEIEPLDIFYPAEAYHQDYYNNNPYQGYCLFVIRPKVAKFRKRYFEQLKA